MITGGRVCDRCYLPVSNNACSTVTLVNPYGPAMTRDLCDVCVGELEQWLEPDPGLRYAGAGAHAGRQVQDDGGTPVERFLAKEAAQCVLPEVCKVLQDTRTLVMRSSAGDSLPDITRSLPDIMVFLPDGRYGFVSYCRGTTAYWGRNRLCYENNTVYRTYDANKGMVAAQLTDVKMAHGVFKDEKRNCMGIVVDTMTIGGFRG